MKKLLFFLFAFLASIGLMHAETVYLAYKASEGANTLTGSDIGAPDGFSIQCTGNTTKNITAGGGDFTINGEKYKTLKFSNKAQHTVTLPAGYVASKVTFYTTINTNAATANACYWAEVAGTTYTENNNKGIIESFKNYTTPNIQSFDLANVNSFTFKNAGEQPMAVIEITYEEEKEEPGPSDPEEPWVAEYPHKWDFTDWSETTVNNLKAADNWSDKEKTTQTEPTETSKDKCFWQVDLSADLSANKYLMANGQVIDELKGLIYKNTTNHRNLAIAVDYPVALSTYNGGAYLWLGGGAADYFVIPAVPAGSTIKMGVESHKTTDARGVQLKIGDNILKASDGTEVAAPTEYTDQEWFVPADVADLNDVLIRNTNGCHIYYIEVTPSEKEIPSLSWNVESTKLKTRDPFTAPVLNNPDNLDVTFSSDNEKVATVDEQGQISLIEGGLGKAVISASFEGNAKYMQTTVSTTIEVVTNVENVNVWEEYENVESIPLSKLYTVDKNSGTLSAGKLIDDEIITIETVFDGAKYGKYATEFLGNKFTNSVQLGRVSDAPSENNEYYGSVNSGNSPIVVTPKKDCKVVMFIRRQSNENKDKLTEVDDVENNVITKTHYWGMEPNDGKSIFAAPHSAIDTKLNQNLVFGAYANPKATDYIFCAVEWDMKAGETYTLYALSTTIHMQGIGYYIERTEVPNNKFGWDDLADPSVYPVNKATMLPLDGSIKLTFASDVNVENAEGFQTTLNDKNVTLTADGKNVLVSYTGLTPLTEYTLTIPAGAIGNADSQIMSSLEYTFTTRQADVLFFSDFNVYPEDYFNKFGNLSANNEFIKNGSTDVTYEAGGMTFYSGTKGRMLAMSGLYSSDSTKDYGPYDATEDAGATAQAVQMIGGTGQYVEFPEMEGPVDVTLWLGNPETSEKTVVLTDENGDTENPLTSFTLPAAKKIKKVTYTYLNNGKVKLRLYNMGKKLDINDALFVASPYRTYKIQYKVGDKVLKEEIKHGLVGDPISIPTKEELDIFVDKEGNKYFYVGNDLGEGDNAKTIAADGSTVVTITYRVPETYKYSVSNNVNDKTIEGTVTERESAYIPYSRYIIAADGAVWRKDHIKIEDGETVIREYRKAITPDKNNYTDSLQYRATTTRNGLFFSEAEDIAGMTRVESPRGSGAAGAYAEGPVTLRTLKPGNYTVHIAYNGVAGASGEQLTIKAGDKVVLEANPDGEWHDLKSAPFMLNAAADLVLSGSSPTRRLDYILISGREAGENDHICYIKYVVDGKVVRTEEITAEFGTQVELDDEYKESFLVDGVKYIYDSDNAKDVTITADGENNTITVICHEAKQYGYKVKNTVNDEVIEGNALEGDEVEVAYNRYIVKEGKAYRMGATDGDYYFRFTPEKDGHEATLTYETEPAFENVVFFGEAEGISSLTATKEGSQAFISCSGTRGGYSAEAAKLFTLAPGTYKIAAGIFGETGNTISMKAGDQTVLSEATNGNWKPAYSTEFTVKAPTDITVEGTDATHPLDFILITGKETQWYAVTAAASPKEAGTVAIDPAEETYEENSEVKLTATANDGYKFVKWTDADGKVVSNQSEFTYTVTGAAAFTANFEELDEVTAFWAMDSEETSGAAVVSEEGIFSATGFDANGAEVTGYQKPDWADDKFIKLKPANGVADAASWNLTPVKGLTFTPTRISAGIARFGTDSKSGVTVTAKTAEGESIVLGTYTAARNNKAQADDNYGKEADYAQKFTIDLTAEQQNKLATAKGFTLEMTIGVGNTKEGGFGQVKINGFMTGEAEEEEPVESITISQAQATIKVGDTLELTATVNPADAIVTWESSNTNVATVDANGKVTAVAEGTATITAKAGDKTAECEVTVSRTSAAELIGLDPEADLKVFDLNGIYVGDTMEGLRQGTYIIRQGDAVKKVRIR